MTTATITRESDLARVKRISRDLMKHLKEARDDLVEAATWEIVMDNGFIANQDEVMDLIESIIIDDVADAKDYDEDELRTAEICIAGEDILLEVYDIMCEASELLKENNDDYNERMREYRELQMPRQ